MRSKCRTMSFYSTEMIIETHYEVYIEEMQLEYKPVEYVPELHMLDTYQKVQSFEPFILGAEIMDTMEIETPKSLWSMGIICR
jgi:hypothetical protein